MTDPTTGQPPAVAEAKASGEGEGGAMVNCPNCRMENTVSDSATTAEVTCHFCASSISLRLFPRLTRAPEQTTGGSLAGDGDATCQFYPTLKAEVICDECGCFMSEKASILWANKNLCMPCLHNLREIRKETGLRGRLNIWDNRALGLLALLPLTLFTAPMALFLLLRYRKAPRGWVPRSSFRWWLAMLLTVVTLLVWTALVVVWVAMLTKELS